MNSKHENSAYSLHKLPSCDEYHAYVVNAGKSTLPFLKWVKTANCHHCDKTGHIRPMCPQYLVDIKTGKLFSCLLSIVLVILATLAMPPKIEFQA